MMKRGKVDKQKKTMGASYRYLGVSNPGLQMIGSNECYVTCLYDNAPGPHSSIAEEFLHSIILRPKKQLETSQYELIPNFRNRKIPRFLFYKI